MRDSGQRKLTYSSQNHCTSTLRSGRRKTIVSQTMCAPAERLSQSRRLPLLQVVSNNKSFSVGVQSPTEINAPRGCAVILRRICQLSLTRITHQVSRAFDLNLHYIPLGRSARRRYWSGRPMVSADRGGLYVLRDLEQDSVNPVLSPSGLISCKKGYPIGYPFA